MWFRRNGSRGAISVEKKIFLFVLVAHLSLILLLTMYHKLFAPKVSHKAIAVHTVHSIPIVATIPAPPQKKASVTENKTAMTKKAPPPPAFRENRQEKKPKKAVAPLKEETTTAALVPLDVKIPELIREERLPVSAVSVTTAYSYGDTLTQFLQQRLQFPERGEVRVRLVVSAQGEIRSVEILDARSAKNAEWLKKELPHLSLPEFRQFGILEPILDFTVTFHNVENF